MNTAYLDFCKKYKKKLETDKDIIENPGSFMDDLRDRITFFVTVRSLSPSAMVFGRADEILFKLDEEDLKYLHDKYSKKIAEEMERNVKAVKDLYET